MKEYWCVFTFSNRVSTDSTRVFAVNKRAAKKVLRDHYGKDVRIESIEKI